MPTLTPDEQAATFRLISETTRDRLVAQRDSVDRIETKGTVLLGFSIATCVRTMPEPKAFQRGFIDVPAHLIEKWLGVVRADAFEVNVALARHKERFYWLTLAALITAGVASIASLAL